MIRLNKVAVLAAAGVAAALAVASFPLEARLYANQPAAGVEPETSIYVPAYEYAPIVFKSLDQLTRVVGNLEQLNALNGRVEDGGLWLELALDEIHPVVTAPAPAPAQTEAIVEITGGAGQAAGGEGGEPESGAGGEASGTGPASDSTPAPAPAPAPAPEPAPAPAPVAEAAKTGKSAKGAAK